MTLSLFVLVIGLTAAPQAVPTHPCPVVDTTQEDSALAAYNARIADYVALHRRLEGPLRPHRELPSARRDGEVTTHVVPS